MDCFDIINNNISSPFKVRKCVRINNFVLSSNLYYYMNLSQIKFMEVHIIYCLLTKSRSRLQMYYLCCVLQTDTKIIAFPKKYNKALFCLLSTFAINCFEGLGIQISDIFYFDGCVICFTYTRSQSQLTGAQTTNRTIIILN